MIEKGKIVCIGGGEIPRNKNGIILPYETEEIDKEIVKLSEKPNPKLLFVGTASSHSEEYFNVIKDIYTKLGCIVSNLDIINNKFDEETLESIVFGTDIVYVGGGNTRFMLEKWRECGLDKILKKAYEKNIVLSGLSAGSYCWFKYNYDMIEGLGLIDAINCVHYNLKDKESKNKFYKVIKDKNMIGYAIDNCVALEFIDDTIKIIKSNKKMSAYKVEYLNGEIIEKVM